MAGAPGPWAGGYVFPDPTQGPAPSPPDQTPAPSPPDQTPAPTGAGPTPQPPTVPPPQAGPAPTLGDVGQAAQGDEGGGLDITTRFNKYRELMKLANADAYRPHLDESTKPGLLANILTLGGAGMWDHDYRQAYNAAVDAGNAKQHAQDTKDALAMVGKDVSLANGNISQQMRMLQLQLNMQNAEYLRHHRDTMEDLARDRNRIAAGGLDVRQTYPPPTPEQRAAAQDAGYDYVPAPGVPNRFNLVPTGTKSGSGGPSPAPPSGTPPAPPGTPPASRTTVQTTGGPPTTVATRLNNPGNITASPATLRFPGVVGTETVGNHTFLKFDSPESGYAGMEAQLQRPLYRNLPFEAGMRLWTTGTTKPSFNEQGRPVGYDLPAMERKLGIAPNTRIADLSDDQRRALVREMATREGYQPGRGGQPSAAPAPSAGQPEPAAPSPAPTGETPSPGLPASGKTSGGIPYRVVTPSGETPPAAHDPSDPNEPGITPSEKLRRQKLREQTAAKPIPAEIQKQVTTIDESIAKMNDIEKLLDDPEVQKWIGPGMGQVSKGLYWTGIGGPGKVNKLLAALAYLRAQAVGPLLHGSRNEKIWAQIQEHLPNASDSPELLRDKLEQARQTYIRNRQIELEASGLTRGQAGGGGQ